MYNWKSKEATIPKFCQSFHDKVEFYKTWVVYKSERIEDITLVINTVLHNSPAKVYGFKANNGNTRNWHEIC